MLQEALEYRHVVKWGERHSRLAAIFTNSRSFSTQVAVELGLAGVEKVLLNGKPVGRLSALLGKVPLLYLGPEDIALFSGSPRLRRKFLDTVLSQWDPEYLYALVRYQRARRQRTLALAQSPLTARSFVPTLINEGFVLTCKRLAFVADIRTAFDELIKDLLMLKDAPVLEYKSAVQSNLAEAGPGFDTYAQACERSFEQASVGLMESGPHRDDLRLRILDGRSFRDTASQGELRAAAVALKLAELLWVEHKAGEKAIVMIDEALHELESARQFKVLAWVARERQVLWAGTQAPEALQRLTHQGQACQTIALTHVTPVAAS